MNQRKSSHNSDSAIETQLTNNAVTKALPAITMITDDSSSTASESLILAAYSTAFARLSFQDDYLIKINTLFLTIQGALVTLIGAGLAQFKSSNHVSTYVALLIGTLLGGFTCTVWEVWIEHNDVWHVINVGILREIEQSHFPETARVFSADGVRLASSHPDREFGIRKRGHEIAKWLPVWLRYGWCVAATAVIVAWATWALHLYGQ